MYSIRTIIIGLIISLLPGCSCNRVIEGSGVSASKEMMFVDINRIAVMTSIGKLILTHDKEKGENLKIEADDNILPYILAEVSNNVLTIKLKNNVQIKPNVPLVFHANLKKEIRVGLTPGVWVETTAETKLEY